MSVDAKSIGRGLAGVSACAAALCLAGDGTPAAFEARLGPPSNALAAHVPAASSDVEAGALVYLPLLERAGPTFPDPELAELAWTAWERFAAAHPIETIYPAYDRSPSPGAANANILAACHDFPDLPDHFGPGAHRRACDVWVAGALSQFHAARAWRAAGGETAPTVAPDRGDIRARGEDAGEPLVWTDGVEADVAWALAYFDVQLTGMADFVYGPGDAPGAGHRDTLAAVWQNPQRAVDVAVTGDLLHSIGALDDERRARAQEILSATARAWRSHFWSVGRTPATDEGVRRPSRMTTRTAAEAPALSLAGRPIVSEVAHHFEWWPDRGNSPAEEMAWMGAGTLLAARALQNRLPAVEREGLEMAARHYLELALSFGRPDTIVGGMARTLNAETEGGAYGQRRLWLENHQPDMPSIPYLGAVWYYLNAAMLASPEDGGGPWEGFANADEWAVIVGSAEATFHGPRGDSLLDLRPGAGLGYAVGGYPAWTMPCGKGEPGAQFVRVEREAPPLPARGRLDGSSATDVGADPIYVSEIGHPAGLVTLAVAAGLVRHAAHRGDVATWNRWRPVAVRVLEEMIAEPPPLDLAGCHVAPYVSDNPGYHWAYMVGTATALSLEGYSISAW